MTCVSCELLLKRRIAEVPGARIVSLDFRTGTLVAECDSAEALEAVKQAVREEFSLQGETAPKARPRPGTQDVIQIVLLAGIAFFLLQFQDAVNLPVFEGASLLAALLLGLVASVSTCLALTGGIVMSLGSAGKAASLGARARPQLWFHAGRVGGFFLLGGLLGTVGQSLAPGPQTAAVLAAVVGVVMLFLALHVLHLMPSPAALGLHLPRKAGELVEGFSRGRRSGVGAAVVGMLTFFLPCGFTQSVQLLAIASQSFWTGGALMAAFALGTLPVLLSLGLGASFAKGGELTLAKKIIGVMIGTFALASMNSALILLGFPSLLPTRGGEANVASQANGVQTVRMDVDWTFKQKSFVVKKDVPVRWEIHAIRLTGCSNEVVIPKLGVRQKLTEGQLSVVEFTPREQGNLPFSCWMGMIYGEFRVE